MRIGLILPNDLDEAIRDIEFIAGAGLRGGVLLPPGVYVVAVAQRGSRWQPLCWSACTISASLALRIVMVGLVRAGGTRYGSRPARSWPRSHWQPS